MPRDEADSKINIRIKYCGGCKPDYARVAAVEMIVAALGKIAVFKFTDYPGTDEVLIIAGCPTACVDPAPFYPGPVRIITSEADAEAFIREHTRENELQPK